MVVEGRAASRALIASFASRCVAKVPRWIFFPDSLV
jgi:hypothetical protein